MITQELIYVYQSISLLEDLYFNALQNSTDDDIRVEIEPIRQAIDYLKQKNTLTPESDAEYDVYIRSIKNLHLYQDRINKLTQNEKA